MGETTYYQTLTKQDKVTVVLYRTGIALSTLIICLSAFFALRLTFGSGPRDYPLLRSGMVMGLLLLALYFSVGLSVFFIHLYVGRFYRLLKKIYYVAVACLVVLFVAGEGNPVMPLFYQPHYYALLLIPLSLCLGFVTAKEAFCFRLLEGYVLAVFMPACLFFFSLGALNDQTAAASFAVIAALLLLFMLRKTFMPLHYDIGDKSAYQP